MVAEKSQRIGITEAGEISFNLDVFDRLYEGNIIITKRLTEKLVEKLIEHRDKCILHITCTGMAGTVIEPLTPSVEQMAKMTMALIEGGFESSHIVLRIDPIVPTQKGLNTAISVLRRFAGFGINRVRVSFLDNYKHVKSRFKEKGIEELYNGEFHAPLEERQKCLTAIMDAAEENGYCSVEVCGEPGIESVSCLSQRDIDILGLTDKITLIGNKGQRGSCGCPANKTELLKVGKPHRCENSCLYCFWK